MIDCKTTREYLDSMTAQERAVNGEVASHLESCPDCQLFAEQLELFDHKVSSLLQAVPVPDGLQERLLSSLSQFESAEQDEQVNILKLPVQSHRSQRWTILQRSLIGTVAAVLIVAISLIWTQPEPTSTLNYADAKSTLQKTFSKIDASNWNRLAAFDQQEFQIKHLDRPLRRWTLSEPVGMDLGKSAAHDAAAYQFSYQIQDGPKWSGTLVVLPTAQFSETPKQTEPESSSGMQILEWQSTDGTLTYLVFVDQGSADELANVMFSAIG
ncbi:anti-sigma factor family protein [Thalassoglobus polymorphus]|uniref:Zinc-finger domain-containing protein n=1 Tax=Thalassoglobus polymorphus TaxID=2527994 RepID=A0A517QPB9_9PLAN|nr:hypothetical protein [Thalassoglobus polymorphus]QDT33479.1 hypothetical protein Mal48_27320 [Thalassoglobus polymorphus]